MPRKTILITGGAGFIGAHVANELLEHGYRVRALDALVPQVHGSDRQRPDYLDAEVELLVGDVRNPEVLTRALSQVDGVIHLVALVGVGQSMYEIEEYTSVNNGGTAALMQVLSNNPVESLVVASSMSIYGEGLYQNAEGVIRCGRPRGMDQLRVGLWEVLDDDGRPLVPVPTTEDKPPALASVYALSKYDQEQMTLLVARSYGMRAVALRFFNTYGPYQALSNPYTGVLSNFAVRVLNGKPPLIYEDGLQKRDLVSVYDVAAACRLALTAPGAAGEAFNIGSGQALTICDVANRVISALGTKNLNAEITGKCRVGDIRHCFADISRAKTILGWAPAVSLEQGLEDLAGWLAGQRTTDRVVEARGELAARGLMI